jgi:hypothetical protein
LTPISQNARRTDKTWYDAMYSSYYSNYYFK